MTDMRSDQQSQTISAVLSAKRPKPASFKWMWVFLIIGLVAGFEVNVQRLIAGPQTYMLLAIIGAAFGRAIDYFHVGRNLRGTVYLLPLAISIMLIALALSFSTTSRFSRLKLPPVDAPEITSLLIRSIENSSEVKATRHEIGELKLSEVVEISFNEAKQERVARAKLNSNLGTEEIFYTVTWHDREKGLIFVQVVDER